MDALTTPQPEFKWLAQAKEDENKIYSILDLINRLRAHGIIEVGDDNGIDYYRIIIPLKETSREERQEQVRRVNAIFRRRQKTQWSDAELTALRHATIPLDELSLVERYYKSEADKPTSYCRTSILTFLRHFPGEVDRARHWEKLSETKEAKHCY